METIVSVMKTSVGIFAAMTVWFLWMGYVRRRLGCRRDQDVLEHMAQGCAGCKATGLSRFQRRGETS